MRLISTILLIGISIMGIAQQTPQYTQYLFNHFMINPAVAGSKECIDLRMGYRVQWVGMEGAPKSGYVSGTSTISENRHVKQGIGGHIQTDEAGPFSALKLQLAYATHFRLDKRKYLSFGLAAGFDQNKFSYNKVKADNKLDDPLLYREKSSFLMPLITAGAWFYNKDKYIGFSIDRLVEMKTKAIGQNTALRRHYYLVAGQKIEAGDDFYFVPSILIKHTAGSKPAIDLNAMFDYKEHILIGFSLRNQDAVAALLKIKVMDNIFVGYSYDYTLSKMRYGSNNSHEIMISITACPGELTHNVVPCSAYD